MTQIAREGGGDSIDHALSSWTGVHEGGYASVGGGSGGGARSVNGERASIGG